MKKTPEKKRPATKIKENAAANFARYESDYAWQESALRSASDVRTTVEMMAFLESEAGRGVEVEARVLAHKPGEGLGFRRLNRTQFIEAFKKNTASRRSFREALDGFSSGGIGGTYANTVGQDFTPLLGGPFYKQLYYYNDWLKQHQEAFYAMNHDPIGKAAIDILVNFTLGKGFRVEFDNEVMQALWDAFEKANNFQEKFRTFARELSGYGENMLWKLPNREKYFVYPRNKLALEDVPKVILPRVMLVDPSNIVEIITYPEDISRALFYVWLTPTQYQIYTARDEKTGKMVSGTKLIYQQIPAEQMLHYKVNAVSNEKRGRSDLFAALPYFKRLRDSINYEIIAQQKNSAWSIDTTIEGDDQDLEAYIQAQQALGTIPNAGSEFVHTKAVQRQYLTNQGTARGTSNAFEWCLSMCAAAMGIPVSYFGTHLSGGQTRASAIVATEPVAKRFEMRQEVYKAVISDVAQWLMQEFGIKSNFEVTFPEIITQDRSQKIKDLYFGETAKWWSRERAAETAANEMGFREYDYETEQQKIGAGDTVEEQLPLANPLTGEPKAQPSTSAVTSGEKKGISDNDGA